MRVPDLVGGLFGGWLIQRVVTEVADQVGDYIRGWLFGKLGGDQTKWVGCLDGWFFECVADKVWGGLEWCMKLN